MGPERRPPRLPLAALPAATYHARFFFRYGPSLAAQATVFAPFAAYPMMLLFVPLVRGISGDACCVPSFADARGRREVGRERESGPSLVSRNATQGRRKESVATS
jgi:hypothetical protein